MDTATRDELRALRARAYGPTADIDQDPAALRRLHELEARQRPGAASDAAAAVHVATAVPAEPETAARPESTAQVEPALPQATTRQPTRPPTRYVGEGGAESPADEHLAAEPDSPTTSPDPTPPKHRLRLRTRLLWALSVVVAAAVAAVVTYAVTSMAPVSVSSGAEQIATLEPDSLVHVPTGWFGAGPSSAAYQYYGLTLFEAAGGFSSAGNGTQCFTIVATEQLPADDADPNSWSVNGPIYSGCRVGPFPATVQFAIDSNSPEELRARFPDGSTLQFVRDGDRIGVFHSGE
ncbi:hypothetical protein Q9R08_04225 [Microbacterium sp. QXD-8]|uniref:Spermidine/putrescine ABC transporter permease n=1 Tax=Microbacterium psychrotolerans TaxID=3068321 RepID=A0ABU0YXX3_9MICO|nr:hypothetical protein [Microbacterium sp. QXD-8]MDQ7877177.1 hypothetical protein [Microbacterium sp. QXD-8]